MINEIEKNTSLNNEMSDLEFSKNSVEMMRYRANSLSYMLGFGGIAFSVFAAFISLNSMNPQSFLVILKILLNIFVILIGFLCCEKAKAYSKQGSIVLIGLGAICVGRIFWIPLWGLLLGNLQGATITNTSNAIAWLPKSAAFRGVTAIILLIAAALFFIFAGLIGYFRSAKLEKYLDSIDAKNWR